MNNTIDFYFAPASGYAYLGHNELLSLARRFEMNIRYCPVDIARIYSASQITPPARQSKPLVKYRMADMARSADQRGLPLNPVPKYWPVKTDLACRVILAAKALQFDVGTVADVIFRAVWVQDENVSDDQTLISLLDKVHLPGQKIIYRADKASIHSQVLEITQQGIDAGVFGSPTYVFENSLYWGDDKLSHLRVTLAKRSPAPVESDAETA